MQQWGYSIVQSNGGQVPTSGGSISVGQMLNLVGQKGGELVTVLSIGAGQYEWIFKFPSQTPQQLF